MDNSERLLITMNEGFAGLHERLNDIVKEGAARQLRCAQKFSDIERGMAVKAALNGARETAEKSRSEFQSWIVRGAMLATLIGVGAILWKIILLHGYHLQ